MGSSVRIRPRGAYNIVYSTVADRSGAVSLDGSRVSGQVYLFVSPVTDVSQVIWQKTLTEVYRSTVVSPFDLVGVSGADALPLDASLLDGAYQYWALVSTGSGNSFTLTASFEAVPSPTADTVEVSVSIPRPTVSASSSVVIPAAVAGATGVSGVTVATGAVTVTTADQNSTARTRAVLALITANVGVSSNRVMSGEHVGNYAGVSLTNWNGINTKTGKYPAIMGVDYDARSGGSSTPNYSSANATIKAHATAGGLVTVSIHAANPQTGGSYTDMTCDIANLITPGHAVHTEWRATLDKYATGLLDLQAADVPVLFRPFHEMNNSTFWWTFRNSTMTVARYRTLWQQTFDYLVNVKNCHNLLWCYSSHASDPAGLGRAAWYPGDSYTDLVGLSDYKGSTVTAADKANIATLHTAVPNKPFAFMEVGKNQSETSWDLTLWRNQLRDDFPYATYFLFWTNALSMNNNPNPSTLINDTIVRNRDEVT